MDGLARTRRMIVDYLRSEEGQATRYRGVAKRFGLDEEQTLQVLKGLIDDGILFKSRGYYYVNGEHLWKKGI